MALRTLFCDGSDEEKDLDRHSPSLLYVTHDLKQVPLGLLLKKAFEHDENIERLTEHFTKAVSEALQKKKHYTFSNGRSPAGYILNPPDEHGKSTSYVQVNLYGPFTIQFTEDQIRTCVEKFAKDNQLSGTVTQNNECLVYAPGTPNERRIPQMTCIFRPI